MSKMSEMSKAQKLVDFLEDCFLVWQNDPIHYTITVMRKEWEAKLKELGLTWKGGW